MYLAGFVLHAVAIWMTPLYLAQATVAMSLPVTAVASMVLHERLTPVHWSALAVVTAGLVLLALGSGAPGDVIVHDAVRRRAASAAVLALALLAALGGRTGRQCAGRHRRTRVRRVRDRRTRRRHRRRRHRPAGGRRRAGRAGVQPGRVLALLARHGARAGLRGHRAADRAQTFVPALVGVALLGDEVRAGWWPAVVAGLVLATGGALVLSRDRTRSAYSPGRTSPLS